MEVAGGFRLLGLTWAAIFAAGALGIGVLAALGPPREPLVRPGVVAERAARPERFSVRPPASRTRLAVAPPPIASLPVAPPRPPGLALAPVDPVLNEPAPVSLGGTLPVIGVDGRRSASVYAARVPAVLPGQSRVALVFDGLGLDEAESRRAVGELPPAVTLALSPYGTGLPALAQAARGAGHEILASVPMEPEGSPLNDEGDRELRPEAPPSENELDLQWALSRAAGIVGATGADTGQNGAHVANAPEVLASVLAETAARGLLYVEPNPGHALPPGIDGVVADRVIDTADAVAEAADLAALADTAVRQGHAFGVVGPLTDRTLAAAEAWIRTLPASGIVLVPASSLAHAAPASTPASTQAPGAAPAPPPATTLAPAATPAPTAGRG